MIVAIVVEFVSLIADIRGRNYVGAVLIACGTGAMTWFAAARIRKLAREESEAMSENKD
jgi:hypothetical protein